MRIKIDSILNELKDIPIKVHDYNPDYEKDFPTRTAKASDVSKYNKVVSKEFEKVKDTEPNKEKEEPAKPFNRDTAKNNILKTLDKLSDEGIEKVNDYVKTVVKKYVK